MWNKKEERDKAIEDLNKAVLLDPSNARAWSNRGVARSKKGEFEKALSDFDEALRLDPNYHNAIHNRALTLALKSFETERKEFTEKLREEYGEQLEITTEQSEEDVAKLRNEAKSTMKQSRNFRDKAANLLKVVFWGWLCVMAITLFVDLGDKNMNPVLFLSWLPAFTIITTPIFLLVFLYLRESGATKNQADKFQHFAIINDLLRRYGKDVSSRNELLKGYFNLENPSEKIPLSTSRNDSLMMPLSSAGAKGIINKTIENLGMDDGN